jgi:predicted RNase H-like HicB family nuclease
MTVRDIIKVLDYVAMYEKSQTGRATHVPDLPGEVTTGRTGEEERSLIQEAVEFHLEGLRENRLATRQLSAEVISVTER